MARVLVVDDSATDRLLVSEILASDEGLRFEGFESGEAALQQMESDPPDMVITDLIMPVMSGFELVAAMRERFPSIPVVLMTSRGNEEIAMKALREGAASYVPKRNLSTDLLDTVSEVLDLAHRRLGEARVLETLRTSELSFCLESQEELVLPLVRHLQDIVMVMGLRDEAGLTQVGMALCEALNNAIEHGNLEVAAELRAVDLTEHRKLMRERQCSPPWCDRRVEVLARLDREEARFVIRDEGPGFDPASLPDPRAPEFLDQLHGRGVFLIRSFMDEVTWNERGNEITMILKKAAD